MKVTLTGTSYENQFFTDATGKDISVADLKEAIKSAVQLKHEKTSAVDSLIKIKAPYKLAGDEEIPGYLPIYSDDGKLYCTDEDGRHALTLSENKYFKNVLMLYGLYFSEKSVDNGAAVTSRGIDKISGYPYMGTAVRLSDEIIDVQEIKLRSVYSKSLENQYKSSMVNINARLVGYRFTGPDDDSPTAVFGYDYSTASSLDKLTAAAKIAMIWPYEYDEDNKLNECVANVEGNASAFNLTEIGAIDVYNTNFENIVSSDDGSALRYYKNNLVVQAKVNMATPNILNFGVSSLANAALGKLSSNDILVDTFALTSTGNAYIQIDAQKTTNYGTIIDVAYGSGYLAVIFQKALVWVKITSWASNWKEEFEVVTFDSTIDVEHFAVSEGCYFDDVVCSLYAKISENSSTLLVKMDFSTLKPQLSVEALPNVTENTDTEDAYTLLNVESDNKSSFVIARDLSLVKPVGDLLTQSTINTTLPVGSYIVSETTSSPWIRYRVEVTGQVSLTAQESSTAKIGRWMNNNRIWAMSDSTNEFKLLKNYHTDEPLEIDIYVVKGSYAPLDNTIYGHDSILSMIPHPAINENKNVFVLVGISDDLPAFMLSGCTIVSAKKTYAPISKLDKVDVTTGPVEDAANNQYAKANNNGHRLFITNNMLYLYNNIDVYAEEGTRQGSSKTINKYWVSGKLPPCRSLNYRAISSLSTTEAYEEVTNVRASLLAAIAADATMNQVEPYKTLVAWLNAHPVLTKDEFVSKYTSGTHNYNLSGVRFDASSNGSIPMFDDSYSTLYAAPLETELIYATATSEHADDSNYLNYLTDYYCDILGADVWLDWDITDVYMTDTSIILRHGADFAIASISSLTSRDAIEDPNNWTIRTVNQNYNVACWDTVSTKHIAYGVGTEVMATEDALAYTRECCFAVEDVYVEDDNIMVAGYTTTKLLSSTAVAKEMENQGICLQGQSRKAAIYLSNDLGLTFNAATLPSISQLSDSSACSFTPQGSSVWATYGEVDRKKGVYILEFKKTGNVYDLPVGETSIGDGANDLRTQGRFSFKFGDVCGTIKQYSVKGSPNLADTNNGVALLMCLPVTLDYAGARVLSISGTSVNVSKYPNASENLEVDLLLSFRTSKDVNIPTDYYAYDERYYGDSGKLLVTEYEQTDSYETANRMYNSNNTVEGSSDNCTSGVPTVLYDKKHDKKFYKYFGDTVREQLNSFDHKIYVVDSSGNYITSLDVEYSDRYVTSARKILQSGGASPWTALPGCPMLADVDMFTSSNEQVTNMFNSLDNKKITYICKDSQDPTVLLTSTSRYKPALLQWPKVGTKVASRSEILNTIGGSFADYITAYESTNGSTEKTFTSLFEAKPMNGQLVVYDKKHDLYLAANVLDATLVSNVSYRTSFDKKSFVNKAATYNGDHIENFDESYPLTGIFLPALGYGGDIYNTPIDNSTNHDWDINLPWDNDTIAFSTADLLKNSYDKYVYLVNNEGLKLKSKCGMDVLAAGDSLLVNYNLLAKEKNAIEMFDDWSDERSGYNIYKLSTGSLSIYTPHDYDGRLLVKVLCDGVDVTNSSTIEVVNQANLSVTDAVITGTTSDDRFIVRAAYLDKTASKIVHVKPMIAYVTSSGYAAFYKGSFASTDTVELELGPNLNDVSVTSDDVTVQEVKTIGKIKVKFDGYKSSAKITLKKGDDMQTINLDIRMYDLRIIANKDWYVDNDSELKYEVLSGTTPLSGGTRKVMDGVISATFESSNVTLSLTKLDAKKGKTIKPTKWIYQNDGNENLYTNTLSEAIITKGLYSYVIMPVLNYESFGELVNQQSYIIKGKSLLDGEVPALTSAQNTRTLIDTDLSEKFDATRDKHILLYKLCTATTINLETTHLNDPEYIYEVPLNKIKTFGYDRVWINPEAFGMSPLIVDGAVYYTENSSEYSTNKWVNSSDQPVYLATEDGRYATVEPLDELTLEVKQLGESADMSDYVTSQFDERVQPYELVYKTSADRFTDAYKSGGNPFNLYVRIREVFNNGEYIIKAIAYEQTKKNGKLILSETDEIKIYDAAINHETGLITFSLVAGTDCRLTASSVKKYGITATRDKTFTKNSVYCFPEKELLDYQAKNSYVIHVTKDDIVDITEVGLYDAQDNLIVYACHPKAEYSTENNHISYNILIEE